MMEEEKKLCCYFFSWVLLMEYEFGVKQIIIGMQLYKTTPNIHIVCIQKKIEPQTKKKSNKECSCRRKKKDHYN